VRDAFRPRLTAGPSIGEFLGTFALLFAGTGAIVVNDFSDGAITHVGIAMTFGLVVMTMIYAVGDVSGAHLNPAVSVGFWLAGRLPLRQVLLYVASQLLGALAASGLLWLLFPSHPTLGATLPEANALQAFVFEVVLTFFLMFVVIHVAVGAKEKGLMAGVAVGGTVGLSAMYAGPATGASMNPVRSLAPALFSGNLDGLWIYVTAPFIGATLAILSCRLLREQGCCAPKAGAPEAGVPESGPGE
jgi:aquaporin Z